MAKFEIISPHTAEECLETLDQIVDTNPQLLDQFWFGCKAGDHTGYAMVDASSESEALNMVPPLVRDKACVVELVKFSPDQIRKAHEA